MSGGPETTQAAIPYAERAARIERALSLLSQPVPGTKGLGPKDRADRLHAEMERRNRLAKEALAYKPGERAWPEETAEVGACSNGQ